MSFTSWYNSHYATWNRTRSIQQRPFVARPNTNLSRTAAAMHNGTPTNDNLKDSKKNDPLFGPNIGVASSGPAWTNASEKKVLTDELTPEIVSNWVVKSKDTSQPTTTLQALVNLKRPTLRVSPLSPDDSAAPGSFDNQRHYHGLEFEYDCDAPRCGIYVHFLLPKDHPDAPATSSSGLAKNLVYESVVHGGFGKFLKIEDGAMLELERFEYTPGKKVAPLKDVPVPGNSSDAPLTQDSAADPNSATTPAARNSRRRFTSHLHFRKRSQGRSAAGPALAVVDEPSHGSDGKDIKDDSYEGVRVMIRLAALDELSTELASPNEQITYLHIVRFGSCVEGTDPSDQDTRPWVVKVVKREATIGPHTFHLHEIFGLTSQTTSNADAATAPLPNAEHTYPPPVSAGGESQGLMQAPKTPITGAIAPVPDDSDPQSECLLCLSSPREVVLLPCRHLVACKDCALNMVEFGAGGNINQAEVPVGAADPVEAAPAAGPSNSAAEAEGNGTAAADASGTSVAPTPALATTNPNARRKRKAKGWFCPVCRQPYTSLLRITTASPPVSREEHDKEVSDKYEEASDRADANGNAANGQDNSRTGILGGSFTPSFLRGLSFGRSPPTDVENTAGVGRAGS